MIIREEREGEHSAIHRVVEAAFGQPDEADLVDALRRDRDIVLGLVAVEDRGEITGHVTLSKMTAPVRALGLAPVAVTPQFHHQGIGSQLVRECLDRARTSGWDAVFVLGEPHYYTRFGFDASLAAPFASPYAGPHFMALELNPGGLSGKRGAVAYPRAFSLF